MEEKPPSLNSTEGKEKKAKSPNGTKVIINTVDDECPCCSGTGDNGIASSGGKCHCGTQGCV